MQPTFDDICCARMPRDALALLASLRVEPGLRVALTEQHAWLRWEAGNDYVRERVMPIDDAVLFRFHEGRWHRFGEVLPDEILEFLVVHHAPFWAGRRRRVRGAGAA